MTVSAALSELIAGFDAADAPEPVRARAGQLILDTLMVARAGAAAPGVSGLLEWQRAEAGRGAGTVWGHGTALPSGRAALLNGFMAAALDYDSLFGSVHADCVVLPAVLAVAEEVGASGRATLSAYIAGVELVCRMSQIARPPQKGWTHTSVFGVFGAAAAAAKLIGLPAEGIRAALGVALSLASGTQQANVEQALTKRLQPALAASNGVFAALAARASIAGPSEPLEGRFGLWALYQQAAEPGRLVEGFGSSFAMLNTTIKKHPVCAAGFVVIDACLELRHRYGLRPDDVIDCDVRMSPFMRRLIGKPMDLSRDPQVAAQFSAAFAVACALIHGRVGIAELSPERILDPALQDLASRVTTQTDPNFDTELTPAVVTIRSRRHGVIECRKDVFPGGSEAPLGSEALDAKLRECAAAAGMGVDRLEALSRDVGRLADLPDMRRFCRRHLA